MNNKMSKEIEDYKDKLEEKFNKGSSDEEKQRLLNLVLLKELIKTLKEQGSNL